VPELSRNTEALGRLIDIDDPAVAFDVVSRWRGGYGEALLVVDQLEELFTQCPTEVQAGFADFLGRLAGEAGIHVLLSMRDDFLMRCHEHAALAPVYAELTPLGPLAGEALRRALEEPAKAEGFCFEEGLVDQMTGAVAAERGALPLLAFAVSRLWEKRDRERKLLTREAYAAIGGVAGSLARHAEATLERIGAERLGMVREVFRNLVTSHGTRAVAEREELLSLFPDRKAAEQVLGRLVDTRLLTSWEVEGTEGQPGHHRVEIVHESLLTAWPRLVRWEAQDADGAVLRDQLRQAAHLWDEKGRSADLLWSGTAFREFQLWRERYAGKLTALEDDFAKAMVERARRRRRLRRSAVAAAFLVLAGVSAAIAVSRHQAAKARDQARAEALRAEASRLVSLAQLRLADDPTEALAYATASLELADTPEARVFVMKSLWEAPPCFILPVGPPAQRAPSFSPDGTRLAAGGHDPVELLWNESAGAPVPLGGNEISERGSNVALWSADGQLVTGLCCGLGAKAHVWSGEGRRLRTIEFGAPTRSQVGKEHVFGETEEGPPGRRMLQLRSWRLPDGEATVLGRVPRGLKGPSFTSAFLPDGTGWVHVRESALFVRPLAAGAIGEERLVGRHGATIDLLLADEKARDRLVSRDKTGELRFWKPTPGRLDLDRVIPRPANAPPSVFPAEPRWVHGHAWNDKKVRLWDLEALPGSRPLELRRRGSWYLAWPHLHPRADWVTVFQWSEGRAAFWPLRKPYPSVVDGYAATHTCPRTGTPCSGPPRSRRAGGASPRPGCTARARGRCACTTWTRARPGCSRSRRRRRAPAAPREHSRESWTESASSTRARPTRPAGPGCAGGIWRGARASWWPRTQPSSSSWAPTAGSRSSARRRRDTRRRAAGSCRRAISSPERRSPSVLPGCASAPRRRPSPARSSPRRVRTASSWGASPATPPTFSWGTRDLWSTWPCRPTRTGSRPAARTTRCASGRCRISRSRHCTRCPTRSCWPG
jgi:hypothetical protein